MKDDVMEAVRRLGETVIDKIEANYPLAAGLATLLLATCLAALWALFHRYRKRSFRLRKMEQLLLNLDISKSLEKHLMYFLELAADVVTAPTYTFYVFEPKNNCFILKAVRHQSDEFGKVRPSYSGLASYKKETYRPPLSLAESGWAPDVQMAVEGEVPLLVVPIPRKKGLMRIGPLSKVHRKTRKDLAGFGLLLERLLDTLCETERMRNRMEIADHSVQALKTISLVAADRKEALRLMLGIILQTFGADGVLYLRRDQGTIEVECAGFDPEDAAAMESNPSLLTPCFSLLEKEEEVVVKRGSEKFGKLAASFTGTECQTVVGFRVADNNGYAALFARFDSSAWNEASFVRLMRTFANDIAQVLQSQSPVKHLSGTHAHLLKALAQMMDNASPYTVGYSEQMSRYSMIVAQQLGMEEDEIRDVGLAAYLSNIGVMGLSSDLYQKEGRFTEMEYETMKLHSEVGAMIVGVTIGNPRVASFIMHHHERMDGNGYPDGLRGDEIPLGARILAVVQTFLAKINSRRTRDPLQFDQALKLLETAAGAQLDDRVVQALLSWFRTKQSHPDSAGRSLGSCWEMCCTPASICEKCPVYTQDALNCWEVEGNLCLAHGKSCEICFVKTEWRTRLAGKG